MAIVEGLIKPWAKHQSAETAAQVAKTSLRGADLAKKQAIKVHLQKIKQPRFTQVVDEVIENPNDLALESARTEVRRKFSGLTERSLPITDRIVDLDEVDTVVKDRARTKLRDFYNRNNQSLRGYREEIGLLNVAGQDIRGKINVSKGVRDVKLKLSLIHI